MILLGMATGVMVGYAAVLFVLLIEVMQVAFFNEGGKLFEILERAPWYRIVFVPAIGGLAAGLAIRYLAPEARGHGVSEVMEAIALNGGVIRGRVAVVKIIASACTLGSGGSVGREGPIVQVGAAIASKMGQIFGANSRQLTTLAGCGSAAGIAAIFNAPIAGAIFALEVILGDFGLATFAPIVLASVMGTVVAQSQLGNYPSFETPAYQFISPFFEVPLYVILGILAGFVSVAFIRALADAEERFARWTLWDPLKTATGGLMIGLIGLAVPHVLGGGYAVMTATLFDRLPWMLLCALLVTKLFATSITVGSGGSGGTFAPALFLGVTLGGIFGNLVHFLFPAQTATAGAYALVGMGAVLAGAAQAPLTALLLAFEITNNYQTILPVMIACSISAIITRRYARDSIYTLKLTRRGINIQAGREVHVLRALKVRDFMTRNVTCVQENMKFGEVLDFISHSRYSDFPVLDPQGELVGVISFNDFREVAFEGGLEDVIVVRDLMTPDVITVAELDDLHTALQQIGSRDVEQMPVVDAKDPKHVVGMLSRRDILTAYNKALVQLRTPAPPPDEPPPPPPEGP